MEVFDGQRNLLVQLRCRPEQGSRARCGVSPDPGVDRLHEVGNATYPEGDEVVRRLASVLLVVEYAVVALVVLPTT
jgi:hypothetical protein